MEQRFLVFSGRPNSGKSAIIRRITGLNTRSGKRPGTTRQVSIYSLSRGLSLVDMPGYGRITGASKRTTSLVKDKILDFIEFNRETIALVIHVLDLSTFGEVAMRMERKGVIPLDIEMILYMEKTIGEMPLIVANKTDKIEGSEEVILSDLMYRITVNTELGSECKIYPVSATTGEGLGFLKNAIQRKLVEKGFRTPFS